MFTPTRRALTLIASLALALSCFFLFKSPQNNHLPIVAIANYGPHASLENCLQGIKTALAEQGFKENEQIRFEIRDVNFELSLISQMLSTLQAKKPAVMVVLATPIAQNAKNTIKDIPLVFASITDPVATGLLVESNRSHQNMTGASDKQDLELFLSFAKALLPEAKTVGLLYASSEANDAALVEMMREAGKKMGIKVLPLAIDNARDIPFRMQAFQNKVDFLYVGVSGAIQPALPTIAALAEKMHIPVFNSHSEAVKQDLALASFGVDYFQVGVNAGNIAAKILRGEKIENIPPSFPQKADHKGFININKAAQYNINIPNDLQHVTRVGEK